MTKYILIIGSILLAGCASNNAAREAQEVEAAKTVLDVEVRIADGVSRIAKAYEQLALIKAAENSDDYRAQSYDYSEHDLPDIWLGEVVLLEDYLGDLTGFIEMVSAIAGLEPPRIDVPNTKRPVLLSITKGERKLISFLADAGHQAGDRALVSPDVALNKIVVTFD